METADGLVPQRSNILEVAQPSGRFTVESESVHSDRKRREALFGVKCSDAGNARFPEVRTLELSVSSAPGLPSPTQGEPRPVERIGSPRILERDTLGRRKRRSLGLASGKFSVKAAHETSGRSVLD